MKLMKLELLNDSLTYGKVIGVRFLYKPICLIINSITGDIIHPDELRETNQEVAAHFATFVLRTDDNTVCLFEFDHTILSGLQGYAARYPSVEELEILLSREKNGLLRMTIGSNSNNRSTAEEMRNYQPLFDKLSDKYMSKIGYSVHDFKKNLSK